MLGRHLRRPLLVVPEAGLAHVLLERLEALAQRSWVKGSPRAASAGHGATRGRCRPRRWTWHESSRRSVGLVPAADAPRWSAACASYSGSSRRSTRSFQNATRPRIGSAPASGSG